MRLPRRQRQQLHLLGIARRVLPDAHQWPATWCCLKRETRWSELNRRPAGYEITHLSEEGLSW